jgi:hypothetical protein
MKNLIYIISLFFFTNLIVSCKKSVEENHSNAEDIISLEMDENNIFMEEEVVSNPCGYDFKSLLASCAEVTESSETFPKTIKIDYGYGCKDVKGRIKKGKIIITVSGNMRIKGNTRTITFSDFYVNDFKIYGKRTSENLGSNASGNTVIKITGDITSSNSEFKRSRTFECYREWIKGIETCSLTDDELHITGSGKAVNRKGVEIAHTITEKIVIKHGECKYPLSGKIDFGTSKRGVTIDFGNGTCDNIAEVKRKQNNKTYTIDLDTHKII